MTRKKPVLKIIRAKRVHIPAVVELWKEFMDYHRALDPHFVRSQNGHHEFRKFIEGSFGSKKQQLLLAMVDRRIVGYALLAILERPPVFDSRRYGMIYDAFVAKKHRRAGIGSVLLRSALQWFAGKGVTQVDLFVMSRNRIGCGFWQKAGFREYVKRMRLEL